VRRLLQVLFWSVIAAAFIGPGTVTTAASAGAGHGDKLLWALAFSTVACLVLQEASGRLTVVSGRDLGQAIRERFHGSGPRVAVPFAVLGAVVLGCAAYEAGNLLGGVAGAVLATGLPRPWLTLAASGVTLLLLWMGTARSVSRILGGVVAFMGVAFLLTAVRLGPEPSALVRGTLLPALPPDSSLLVVGLIGTTVVPYNLFLGSGLARGQTLGELRFGLSVAVVLGGLISMAVLVVGTAVDPPLTFEALGETLRARLGGWAESLFAWGLLAAGLSSAITAPLAAAVAATSLVSPGGADGDGGRGPGGPERSWPFRGVWLLVLLTGMGFGLAEVQPIPAIILAQALNGILLPFVAVFLMLVVNDARLMGRPGLNGPFSNAVMGVVVAVTVLLGTLSVWRAVASVAGLAPPSEGRLLLLAGLLVAALVYPVARALIARRRAA
jgi:manganese transport protein